MRQKTVEKRTKVYEFLLLTVWGPEGEDYEKIRCQKYIEKILYAWSPDEFATVVEPYPKEETKSNYHIHFFLWFGVGKRKNISRRLIQKTALITDIPTNGVHYKTYGNEKTDTVRRLQAASNFLNYCTGKSEKASKHDYFEMKISTALEKVIEHVEEKLLKATAHKEKTGADVCDPVKFIQSLILNGTGLKKIAISIAHSYKMEPTPENFKTYTVLTAKLQDFQRFEKNHKEIEMWRRYDHERVPTKLMPWQEKLTEIALKDPGDRIVNVLVGQGGKSTLGRVWEEKYNAAVLPNAQTKDAAESYFGEPIVVLDLPKKHDPKDLNYELLESFKDGRLYKNKWSSYTKVFKPPQVWVFTNKHLDYSNLTHETRENNRWRIWNLKDGEIKNVTETVLFTQFEDEEATFFFDGD